MKEVNLSNKEEKLKNRLERLKKLEREVKEKEKEIKSKENARKQVLLRLPASLWNDIYEWSQEDLRSINGQIEFLLRDAVKKHKKK